MAANLSQIPVPEWDSLMMPEGDYTITERRYFSMLHIRAVGTFMAAIFVLFFGFVTPGAALALAFVTVLLEGLAARMSRSGSATKRRRLIIANLVLYLFTVCAITAAIVIPGKMSGPMVGPMTTADSASGRSPNDWSSSRNDARDGFQTAVRWFSRIPAVTVLAFSLAAGSNLPVLRVRSWRNLVEAGMDDEFPGVVVLGSSGGGPDGVLPASAARFSDQEGEGAASPGGGLGPLSNAFRFQQRQRIDSDESTLVA